MRTESSPTFARYPIVIHDVIWYTTEHYVQAMKFAHDPEYQEKIRTTNRVTILKMGQTRQIKLRPDWEEVKDNIMMIALRAKIRSISCAETIILDGGK